MAQGKDANHANGGSQRRIMRQLGSMEKYQSSKQQLECYDGTVVACSYSIPEALSNPERHESLVQAVDVALAQTVLQHPVLQVGIIGEKTKAPGFVGLQNIDFNSHVKWRVVEAVDLDTVEAEALQHAADEPFNDRANTPSWRVAIVYQQGTRSINLIYSWNHSIHDGMGAKIFHETLLQSLNAPDLKLGLMGRILELSGEPPNFPPPQDKMCKYSTSSGYKAAAIWSQLQLARSRGNVGTTATWAPIALEPHRTQIRTFTIGDATIQNILGACRQHKTTVTSLLHGIILVSLASRLTEKQAPGFNAYTAVDMRRFTPRAPPAYPWLEPKRTLGDIVSAMDFEMKAPYVAKIRARIHNASAKDDKASLADIVWTGAVTASERINDVLSLGLKNNKVGLMKYVSDWPDHFKTELQRARVHSWLVTNIGVVDGSPKPEGSAASSWAIERGRFILSRDTTGPALQFGLITVKGREMVVDVTWQDTVVDTKFAESVVRDVEEWLQFLGQ